MTKESKTLLKKIVHTGKLDINIPERIYYNIYASALPGIPMTQSSQIVAEKFNKADYLIVEHSVGLRQLPLAIVNENHTADEVLNTMYEEAVKVAKRLAKYSNNFLLDLTGNVPISEEDKKYL